MKMSNKMYNILKYICQIALPAILTCISTIFSLCGIGADIIALVVGIGTAVDTLIGTLLGISTHNYNKLHDADEIESERWPDDER